MKSQPTVSISETSVSSSAPLNVLIEKKKAKRIKVVKKVLLPPVHVPFGDESDSGSNEPVAMRAKTAEVPPTTVEPTLGDASSTPVDVVRLDVVESAERPAEAVDQSIVRANEEEAQRLAKSIVEVVIPTILPIEEPATAPVNSLNPTLGIMDVVHAVNGEFGEEVNIPPQVVVDFDRVLTAQFDSMLVKPIARVENHETTQTISEDD